MKREPGTIDTRREDMNTKVRSRSSALPNSERRNEMNTQTPSESMGRMIRFFLFLFAVLVLYSCSPKDLADKSSCPVDMDMRVTIDLTDVEPRVVFDQLAREPDCAITVSPFVWKHITLHVEDATVAEVLAVVCPQIGCKYILNENHLTINPFMVVDRIQADRWEEFGRKMEERNRILQSRLPEGMSFEDAPLSRALEEISKASGLEIKPWKDEGNRKVTIDVSDMTVDEALKAVVLYVDGEGAVMIKLWYGFPRAYGQYWLWGYP
jgi:hypothetical protein